MSWFGRFFRGGAARGPDDDPHGYYVTVRCNKCGEEIRVRVNLQNDLAERLSDDSSDRVIGYMAEKGIVGNNFTCGQTMRLYLEFDSGRHLVSQRAEGGVIVDA